MSTDILRLKGATMIARLFLLLVISVVVTSCGQATPTANPMTVEEYAKVVCDPGETPDPATWGEARKTLQGLIELGDGTTPPDPVRDYHLASLAAQKAFLKAIEEKSPNDMYNPFELVGESDLLIATQLRETARSELDEETQRILKSHGCLDES